MVSVVDIIQRFCMVSVVVFVGGFRRRRKRVVYGFHRWFFLVSVVPGKRVFMVSVAGFVLDSAAAGGFIIL